MRIYGSAYVQTHWLSEHAAYWLYKKYTMLKKGIMVSFCRITGPLQETQEKHSTH